MKFWHGGPAGLASILPPDITGARCTAHMIVGPNVARSDCVYVTTRFEAACMFASAFRIPRVYEVEPVDLRPDPDCSEPGLSFEASFAIIIASRSVPGKIIKKARKAFMTEPLLP